MHKNAYRMVTQEEIDGVWGNANFGSMSRMEVIKFGLLKCAGRWHQGGTSKWLLTKLGLIGKNYTLTKRGSRCLYNFFRAEQMP